MNKNLQYTLMSLTGILLMIIAAGAFDSEPDMGYEDTAAVDIQDIEEPVEPPTYIPDDVTVVVEDSGVEDNSVSDEQHIEWVDQLTAVDMEYPNDRQRLEMYQSLLDNNNNAYAPIFLASNQLNVENESKSIGRFEELLASFGFDVASIDSLEALANTQNVNAMFVLGVYYYQMQRYDQARHWLEQASTQGHAGAMNQLAWIYRKGLGVSKDLEYAATWHRHSAEANYPRAMTNLAYLYDVGGGVEKDLEASAMWYKKAAELNSASGLYAVAVYALNGTGGMPQDEQEGLRLLMESAELGHKRSMYVIGQRYENGDGLDMDMEMAVHWYSESAALGERDAITAMSRLNY